MKFITLTGRDGEEYIILNAEQICCMWPMKGYTQVQTGGPYLFEIKESIEEILEKCNG